MLYIESISSITKDVTARTRSVRRDTASVINWDSTVPQYVSVYSARMVRICQINSYRMKSKCKTMK